MAYPDTKDEVIERQMCEIIRLQAAIKKMVQAAPDIPELEDIALEALADRIDTL